jgi:energy-coupling factor transporter ATP-binding protein EcfA2
MSAAIFEHVVKRYGAGGRPAVDDCSLTVEEGQLVVLLGPSGCGKTTLLKMVNRINGEIEAGALAAGLLAVLVDLLLRLLEYWTARYSGRTPAPAGGGRRAAAGCGEVPRGPAAALSKRLYETRPQPHGRAGVLKGLTAQRVRGLSRRCLAVRLLCSPRQARGAAIRFCPVPPRAAP